LYGKKAEDFEDMAAMYLNFLKDYPVDKVRAAFERYVRNAREFPTPSDIISILEGKVKRDPAYYRFLIEHRKNNYLTTQQEEYVKKYEKQLFEEWA
jgi:transcription initiation factor TFIIIB Brf1 subunit/transcription initiation factor TFIIB